MSNTSIKVEDLSKIYRLGEIGTGTISRDMERWFKMKILKQEDPFLKIGETNDRGKIGASDIVYSLRDMNLEIEQGEAVGIIGRNGAGKSTLLKILSRVTTPTTGKINIKGRVASLLEVGTGFHPELTGRENIYLNGAILGMRKREIDRKLDEIIEFSGVERYIDTPVKRYSSGMYVRLAFAVAAHLESEILIVDEVLAVGDAEFQKKCLGKMNEISSAQGRTVLFVSHNMSAIKSICSVGLEVINGTTSGKFSIDKVINSYVNSTSNLNSPNFWLNNSCLSEFRIYSEGNNELNSVQLGSPLKIEFIIENKSELKLRYEFNIEIKTLSGVSITSIGNEFNGRPLMINPNEITRISITTERILLMPGEYSVLFYLNDGYSYKIMDNYSILQVAFCDLYKTGKLPYLERHGNIISEFKLDYCGIR